MPNLVSTEIHALLALQTAVIEEEWDQDARLVGPPPKVEVAIASLNVSFTARPHLGRMQILNSDSEMVGLPQLHDTEAQMAHLSLIFKLPRRKPEGWGSW